MKKLSKEEVRDRKLALYEKVQAGNVTIGQATREMRKIVGMTQKEYAEKVLGIFPRVLMDIENDKGNPTLETLQKIAGPFGLRIGFVKSGGVITETNPVRTTLQKNSAEKSSGAVHLSPTVKPRCSERG